MPLTPEDGWTLRAGVAARIMIVRGLLIRVVTTGGALVLLSFITPAEFGLLAIVRGLTAAIEQGTELGLVWPLLSQPHDPDREEYASLGGAQLLIVLVILGITAVWAPASTVFNALDPQWHMWLVAVIAAMVTIPLGTGARVRLERELRYTRIAFAEVSALLVHTVVLIGFLLAGHFAIGVFIAQVAITLYLNGVLYASSPGPLPTWHVGRALHRVKSSAGYSAAYLIFVARENLPPLMVAALFGLRVAGIWAFAARLSKLLQFAHEGFARVALPTAARLVPDRSALRRLAADSLAGAGIVAIPMAALVVFALPAVPIFWPQWSTAVPLAQIYVPCDVTAGVVAAGLAPIALALRGWRAVFIEHAVPLLVTCAAFLLLSRLGRDTLQYAVVPIYLAALAALFVITDSAIRPAWNRDFTRLASSLACGSAVYVAGQMLRLPPMATAALASAVLMAWLWPQWLYQFGRMRESGS
jgi:O-antigen/teichoic acid export membrane protein